MDERLTTLDMKYNRNLSEDESTNTSKKNHKPMKMSKFERLRRD